MAHHSLDAALVRGALDLEITDQGVLPHRLPRWAREQIPDDQLAMAEAQPSGVRLAFRTSASSIELDVLPTKMAYQGAPPRPDGVYDLLVDGRLDSRATATGGNVRTTDMASGSTVTTPGPVATVVFSGLEARAKQVEIWLPHNEITELVALRTDATTTVNPQRDRLTWLHHGSSISQGSNAERARARPGLHWPHPSVMWSWSAWGSVEVPCSTRSPRGPCEALPRT